MYVRTCTKSNSTTFVRFFLSGAGVCTWLVGCEFACDRDCDYVSMCAIVFSCVRAIVSSGVFLVKGREEEMKTQMMFWCTGTPHS